MCRFSGPSDSISPLELQIGRHENIANRMTGFACSWRKKGYTTHEMSW